MFGFDEEVEAANCALRATKTRIKSILESGSIFSQRNGADSLGMLKSKSWSLSLY